MLRAMSLHVAFSVARLHLQNPKIPTQPWWAADDLRLPRWIRNLGRGRVARQIRSDLLQCLEGDSVAFDDSANDWFFVGSKQRWTGLNLMHSQRGGWQQQWCGQKMVVQGEPVKGFDGEANSITAIGKTYRKLLGQVHRLPCMWTFMPSQQVLISFRTWATTYGSPFILH